MSAVHNEGLGSAGDPDDHTGAGSPDDDVDCCEVCAMPAWVAEPAAVVEPIVRSLARAGTGVSALVP